MTIDEVNQMFRRLGMERPSRYFMPFGFWSEEGLEIESEREEHVREVEDVLMGRTKTEKVCTCCECNLTIGPPGCDGTNCRSCGRC